jgi:L-fuconate dehydratase
MRGLNMTKRMDDADASGGPRGEGLGPALRKAGGEGFTDFKMKVGDAAFEVDVDRVRAAHEAIGPGDRLALDANNVWRCPYEAIRFAGAVEDRDIW